jgi:hypothetical protein
VALRRRGIQHVAGIAWDPESQAKRANSYDTIWRVDNLPVPTGDFDAVLCTPGAQSGHSLDGLLEFAKGWLVPGGRLLLGVAPFELAAVADEGDTNALSYWFAARGYQLLTRCRLGEGEPYQLIAMATVEATLDGVNQAMYREFPVNGTNAEPWNGVMGEEESGSPDAGDP